MPIQTVQAGTTNLRTIKVKKHVIGPGGTPLFEGDIVRVPEPDAYTLVLGEQAEFAEDPPQKGGSK
jgi:hypothetical protein